MGKYSVYDVFTPTTPARIAFVEREAVNDRLVNALRTPGKQVVVYGHSGSGKTTLLVNKLNQLYESHITTRCMSGMVFDQLVLDAFDQLSPYYVSEVGSVSKKTIDAKISGDYLAIKSQIGFSATEEGSEKKIRMLPPQLTPQALSRFVGASGCCWVIEDFHKVADEERAKLSQIMKVFMDAADEYRQLKVVAIGAVDTARQVVEYDPEMKNRVAEIHVPLMSVEEIRGIIALGAEKMNLDIGDDLSNGISHYSNGVASVCHHLCLNMCTSQGVYETQSNCLVFGDDTLDSAIQIYIDEASDTLSSAFENAFKQEKVKKFDNARLILQALSKFPQDGAQRAEIYQEIKKYEPKYPQGNLTVFLGKISNDRKFPLVRYDENSGRYSFIEPIYRSFAVSIFSKQGPKLSADGNSQWTVGDYAIDLKSVVRELNKDIKQEIVQVTWKIKHR